MKNEVELTTDDNESDNEVMVEDNTTDAVAGDSVVDESTEAQVEAPETVEEAVAEILDETMSDDDEIVDGAEPQNTAMPLAREDLKSLLEAAIFAAGEPMTMKRLMALFDEDNAPSNDELKQALEELTDDYSQRGVELKHVASGYRFQARADYAGYLQKLWEKKPPRFSRAMLETLALIVYRQPITRGEIEEVRGVSTSSNIMKGLVDRSWVKIVAYKDVPGKPALYGTTKDFLDYFDLKTLKELPDLKDIVDLEQKEKELNEQLVLNMSLQEQGAPESDVAHIDPEQLQDEMPVDSESEVTQSETEQLGDDADKEPDTVEVEIETDQDNEDGKHELEALLIDTEQDQDEEAQAPESVNPETE